MHKFIFSIFIIAFLSACGGPVKIEGDVFLVKGDGKPQPAAAKEVIFLNLDKETGLEDLLTNIYLDSIKEEVAKNEKSIIDLCSKSSNNIQKSLDEKNKSLEKIINSSKTDGTTDPDGSCSLINSNSERSVSASLDKQNYYQDLISTERKKISDAKNLIGSLQSSRWSKIKNKENELYKEFIGNITISRTGNNKTLKIVNNSPYNIRIKDHLKVQFYNYLKKPKGSHKRIRDWTTTRYGACGGTWNDYRDDGFAILSSYINKDRGTDSFGFKKTSYLAKGAMAEGEENFICREGFTPSERLELTKKYGADEKSWPDKNIIDDTVDYTITSGTFIPLEDEIREEVNGTIVYTSKEINFLTIARNLSWPETSKIKKHESVIKNANLEIIKLQSSKQNDPLISTAMTNQNASKKCEDHQNMVADEEEAIGLISKTQAVSQACDLNNTNLISNLVLEETSDLKLRDKLLKVDYSSIATNEALNIISKAEHKVSTNISGHYQINELPRGQYLVISNYADNFNEGMFLLNTYIDADGIVDLSNASYFSIPSFGYLVATFYQNCSETNCTRDDFINSLDLKAISDRYLEYEEELKESAEDLRRLCRKYGLNC